MIELSRSDASRLLNLVGRGLALSGQGIPTKEAPPALRASLRKPRTCRNEDVMEARMLSHPGLGLSTAMAARD
jgi:hypothetical protein